MEFLHLKLCMVSLPYMNYFVFLAAYVFHTEEIILNINLNPEVFHVFFLVTIHLIKDFDAEILNHIEYLSLDILDLMKQSFHHLHPICSLLLHCQIIFLFMIPVPQLLLCLALILLQVLDPYHQSLHLYHVNHVP
jgi:hypothetical protein